MFCNSYTDGFNNVFNLNVHSPNWDLFYYENNNVQKMNGVLGSYSQSNTYHAFLVFNSNGTNGFYLYTDGNSTANITATSSVTSSAVFAGMVYFSIGHSYFDATSCSNMTVYYANLLPVALSTSQMGSIATGTII